MKSVFLFIPLFFIIITTTAQDNKEIARVYYKKAVKSYSEKDFEKTEKYLGKNISYFGSVESKEIAVFGAEFFFEQHKFIKAKEYLTAFFKLDKKKKSKNYNDMLLLYTDTLDAIDNPDKFKKEKVIVSPKIITVKDNETSIDEGSNNLDENDSSKGEGFYNQVVPFSVIENSPVFPGCYGNSAELKDCFSKMIQMHFSTFFDANLPSTLGLSKGKKKVLIGFLINSSGNVTDIIVRAPHPKLKEEVIRVMKLLPEMKPGTQRGKNVNVKYSFPFTLNVG